MKFTSSKGSVIELDPGIENEKFGVEINEKTFAVLVDTLYSNKIKALIRELSCNAFDSHVEAGNKSPIEVHLPTVQNPFFYVKDEGVGLDLKGFKEVYTQFFKSTKDTSNRYTGSLGLGSKVPFSYGTKSFTVEAIKDGVKIICNCYLENGLPSWAKLSETKTNEPNGVKVQFPVERRDFQAFYNEARNVFKYFSQKPKIVGEDGIDIPTFNKLLEGNGWSVCSGEKCTLVMGNIGYDVVCGEDGLNKYSHLINAPIVIEAKLGEVEFEAAREGLSYTKKTVAFLQKRFKEISSEIVKNIKDQISSSKNLFDARIKLSEIKNTLHYSVNNIIDYNHIDYNGEKVTTQKKMDIEGVVVHKYEYSSWRKNPRKNYSKIISFSNDKNYILNDLKKGQHGRTAFLTQESEKDSYIFLVNSKEFPDAEKKLLEFLGCNRSDLTLSSSLPKPHNTPKNPNIKRTPLTELMEYEFDYRTSKAFKPVNLDVKKMKGVYVVRKAYTWFNKETNSYQTNDSIITLLESVGEKKQKVYAVNKSGEQDLVDAGWVQLNDWVDACILKKKDEFIDLATYSEISVKNFWSHVTENISYIPEIKELSSKYTEYKQNTSYYKTFPRKVKTIFSDEIKREVNKKQKEIDKTTSEIESVLRKYPLLNERVTNKQELIYYYKGKNV